MPSFLPQPSILDAPVAGRHLCPGTLRDQIGSRPTLLVFLRHLGCLFCREWLADLRRQASADPTFPAILFFHLGSTEQGDAFFSALAPEARAVSDADRLFYHAFGVPRAPKRQMLNPRVWLCGVRASGKGHRPGMPIGDPFQMPGLFLIEGDRIAWSFLPAHMGELPQVADIPRPLVV